MIIRKYRKGGHRSDRICRTAPTCYRSKWARGRRKVEMRNGPHGEHLSVQRGSWLYQYFRYCGYDTSIQMAEHDPLRWQGSEFLSSQRHNGMPMLAGVTVREQDMLSVMEL